MHFGTSGHNLAGTAQSNNSRVNRPGLYGAVLSVCAVHRHESKVVVARKLLEGCATLKDIVNDLGFSMPTSTDGCRRLPVPEKPVG